MARHNRGRSKQDYATPPEFIVAVKKLLWIEEFAIDLAADPSNTKAAQFYSEQDSAFDHSWEDIEGWAWCNPPYDHIEPWVMKAYLSGSQIAMLLPASVGSNWWKQWVHNKAIVLLLNGRLAFMPDKPKWLYPKDCVLLLYGCNIDPFTDKLYEIWSWKAESNRVTGMT